MEKRFSRVNIHTFGEELGVALDKLARHGGCRKLAQRFSVVALFCAHSNLLDLVDSHSGCSPQTLDNDL